jgi:hypothetical protein
MYFRFSTARKPILQLRRIPRLEIFLLLAIQNGMERRRRQERMDRRFLML